LPLSELNSPQFKRGLVLTLDADARHINLPFGHWHQISWASQPPQTCKQDNRCPSVPGAERWPAMADVPNRYHTSKQRYTCSLESHHPGSWCFSRCPTPLPNPASPLTQKGAWSSFSSRPRSLGSRCCRHTYWHTQPRRAGALLGTARGTSPSIFWPPSRPGGSGGATPSPAGGGGPPTGTGRSGHRCSRRRGTPRGHPVPSDGLPWPSTHGICTWS